MEDAVFVAFEAFDFEGNATFQRGWSSLETLFVSDSKAWEREYLRAKAFFFSKYVQSFDFEKYKTWKSENRDQLEKVNSKDVESERKNPKGDNGDSCSRADKAARVHSDIVPVSHLQEVVKENKHSASLSACDISKDNNESGLVKDDSQCSDKNSLDVDGNDSNQGTEQKLENGKNEIDNETEKQEDCLSLSELAMFVQNGLPIPGLISVDVKPTNKDPTPSTLSRKPKPWEMDKKEENITEKEKSS